MSGTHRAMGGWLALALCLSALGCAKSAIHATHPRGTEPHRPLEVHGTHVVALRTAEGGDATLSLFVDAGARDADPPQVATLAALVAVEAAGPGFEARVTPDGTEIRGTCAAAGLDDCIGALARALARREVDPETLTRAHRTLAARRRRARNDDAREAHRVALHALLGPKAARGLDPLGEPDGDDAADATALARFLAAHYGPARALLAASGAIAPAEVTDAVERTFADLPRALTGRAERPPLVPRTSVAVEVGALGAVSVAAQVDDAAHGRAVAHALLEAGLPRRLDQRDPPALDAHAFDLRGASFVIVRAVPVGEVRRATRELAFELGRALVEAEPLAHASPPDPPGIDPARALGQRWLVGALDAGPAPSEASPDPGATTATATVHVGVGAVLPGGRADRVGASDPDAVLRRSARGRLTTALEAAMESLTPPRRGTAHADGARVVLANGARVDVRRMPRHRRVRIRVRVAGGAAEDPPGMHGRTALHATAMSRGCVGHPHAALRLRLRRLGAAWAPTVDADAFGFTLDAPREGWQEALDLALACLTAPDLSAAALQGAREALAQTFAQGPPYRAWAARALAPRTPGTVAPWGTPDDLAHVDRPDVVRAHGERVVGARTHLTVDGDLPVLDVLERAARRLARLRPGRLAAPLPPGAPVDEPLLLSAAADPAATVLAWRLGPDVDAQRAQAFARQAALALAEGPAPRAVWSEGGRAPWGAWAAVGLVVPRETVGSLVDRARRVGERIADGEGVGEVRLVGPVVGPNPD
jgi:predicted Zn-dependent peptidase